ncbi:MAG: nitroreductase [Microbacterium sp.]|nr:nitroreductase [Microbacterium sp.]
MSTPLQQQLLQRASRSRVGDTAPSHEELLPLVRAASRVADHGGLRPWRLIEIRGDARRKLARALAKGEKLKDATGDRISGKPFRAPLLIAVVSSRKKSSKVPGWEQDAVAAGVAHVLTLLLEEQGWGVMWRTGPAIRSKPVRKAHGLGKRERLLGWLYVGSAERDPGPANKPVHPSEHLSVLE